MNLPRIFVGSASEGIEVAKAVRKLLLNELDAGADIKLWTVSFDFNAAYIESLERSSRDADFAVFIFTTDDVTGSRA